MRAISSFALLLATAALSSVSAADPVVCDYIAFTVGNVSISSTTDSSVNLQKLDVGPSHNLAGDLLLQEAPAGVNAIDWLFVVCNSSFAGYTSWGSEGNGTTFYGHIIRSGGVGESAQKWCLQRSPITGNLIRGLCSFEDGPVQLNQYWKLVKDDIDPYLPAPLTFLGVPSNVTKTPFKPTLRNFNGTKIVSEQLTRGEGEFALYYTVERH